MRRSRRGCLPVLLLLTAVILEASAVALKRTDSLDPLDPDWEVKDGYYQKADGLYCQKCPKGTYLAEECKEQNSSGRCEPCRDGEYMDYPTTLRWCPSCTKCREDQVELSPCQPVRNTVCACRNGTFCPPDHPCEMCQKCQPRCPEGQVVLKPCTPYSDLVCGPAADTRPVYLYVIISVVLLLVILFGFYIWKLNCSSSGDGRPLSRRPYEMVSSMFRKLLWYRRVNVETEDNVTNDRVQSQQCPTAPETPHQVMLQSGRPERSPLVPAPGIEHVQALRRSIYTFAKKVPKNDWKKFGRSLDLEENDIVQEWTEDAFYQMLYKWLVREGTKSSVNILLETLDRLHLGGVAEDISITLVQKGLFQYEAS